MPVPARTPKAVWVVLAAAAIGAVAGVVHWTGRPEVTPTESSAPSGLPIEPSGIPVEEGDARPAAPSPVTPASEVEPAATDPGTDAPRLARTPSPERVDADPPPGSRTSPRGSPDPAAVGATSDAERGNRASRPVAVRGEAGGTVAPRGETGAASPSAGSVAGTFAAPPVPAGGAGSEATRVDPEIADSASPGVVLPAAPGSAPPPRGEPAGTPQPDSLAVVTMIPSVSRVAVGDPVSLRIAIDGAANVGHVPFHVRFDPGVLRFLSGEEGSFLGSDGQSTAFFAAPTSDGAAVVVGLSRLGRVGGVSGSGELCVLHFEVVGPGPAGLAFSRAKVRDSSNAIVPASFLPAAVIAGGVGS